MVEYLKKYRQIETQLRDGRKIYRGVKSRGLVCTSYKHEQNNINFVDGDNTEKLKVQSNLLERSLVAKNKEKEVLSTTLLQILRVGLDMAFRDHNLINHYGQQLSGALKQVAEASKASFVSNYEQRMQD
ncbi:hypothetical protein YC2023_085953 [Brassica napus]